MNNFEEIFELFSLNKRSLHDKKNLYEVGKKLRDEFYKNLYPKLNEIQKNKCIVGINLSNINEYYITDNIKNMKWIIIDSGRNNADDVYIIFKLH